jgi:long-chain acyl-CoA synthetase
MDLPRRPGYVGRPIWGVEIRIALEDGTPAAVGEPGEVLIRGHNVMKGYLGRPEATLEAIDGQGWFHSGDIGRLDADGYLAIVDRQKDMIIRGVHRLLPHAGRRGDRVDAAAGVALVEEDVGGGLQDRAALRG